MSDNFVFFESLSLFLPTCNHLCQSLILKDCKMRYLFIKFLINHWKVWYCLKNTLKLYQWCHMARNSGP